MPGMQWWFNMCRSKNVIHHVIKTENQKHMRVSIDKEKTFDEMEHRFILKTPSRIGLKGTFHRIIRTFMKNPKPTS